MSIEYMINACIVDLKKLTGVGIMREDIGTILENDIDLRNQLEESYDFTQYNGMRGLDTYDREFVLDAFAKFIGGEHWPCNEEHGSEYEQQFIDLLIDYSNGNE